MARSKGPRSNSDRSLTKPRKKRVPLDREDKSEEPGPSASAKKMKFASTEKIAVDIQFAYRIIQFAAVFSAISDKMVCRKCGKTVHFSESDCRGFGFKIVLKCRCGEENIPSCPYINNGYEVNRRMVFVMKHSATLLLMKILELYIGPTCKLTADGHDQRRLSQQARATAKESKEARTIARMERIKKMSYSKNRKD